LEAAAYKVFLKIISSGLHFFFFTLSKGIDDAQSFLVCNLSTKLSLCILFSYESCAHSVTAGIMMNRRQLEWWNVTTRVRNNAKRASTRKYLKGLGNLCSSTISGGLY